jgi:EmrB/QacA subfamily drug resistance transporter
MTEPRIQRPSAQQPAALDADPAPVPAAAGNAKWWTLVAVCLGTFMLLLDITIVNVALPDIQTALGSSFSGLQWVIDAYALSLAALLLTAGSLADMYGRRRLYLIGLVIFTGASLLCGLATSTLMLQLSRGLQGVGGAIMFSVSLALLASSFHGKDRGVAFGVWGAITGLAVAIGPLLGGGLTSGLSWRWIFLVNLPIGVVAVIITALRVGETREAHARRPDWAGFVLFTAALASLVYGLIESNRRSFSDGLVLGCLIAAGVLLAAFLVAEWRGRTPMFDLSLFRKPSFSGASVAAFVLSASMFAMFLYLTLWVQNVLGYSALEAGLRFLPITLVSFAVAPVSGKLSERHGVRWFLSGGLVLVGVGLLLMRGLAPGDDWTALLFGFLLAGLGIGLTNPALATAAIGVVEPRRSGMASGINSTFRQVGVATGIAAWGAIFQHQVTQKFLAEAGPAADRFRGANIADFVAFGGAQKTGNATVIRLAETAFDSGLNHILLIAGVIALAGAAVTAVLVRPADFVAHAPAAAPPQPVEA